MVQLKINQNDVRVYVDSTLIGTIELYSNSCHMQNQYLKIESMVFDTKISAELFRELFDIMRSPLQIM